MYYEKERIISEITAKPDGRSYVRRQDRWKELQSEDLKATCRNKSRLAPLLSVDLRNDFGLQRKWHRRESNPGHLALATSALATKPSTWSTSVRRKTMKKTVEEVASNYLERMLIKYKQLMQQLQKNPPSYVSSFPTYWPTGTCCWIIVSHWPTSHLTTIHNW